jgi:phage baseplate assembly protein W
MFLDYPLQIDARGRTGLTTEEEHIRDLIEQVLFTGPGERVNRPTFGSGLPQLLFMPTNDELVTATQFLVQGALQQWLGDIIQVESVDVERQGDSAVRVSVQYVVHRTQERQVAQLSRVV